MTNQPISQLLRRLWSQFEPRRRVQLKLLLALMVIASFAEVLSIGAGIIRLLLVWASTRLSFAIGSDLSLKIYRNTMYQTYAVYCTHNSSEIISATSTKVRTAIDVLSNALLLASSTVILVVTLIALFTIDFVTALAIFGSFGLIYASIIGLTRKQLLTDSQHLRWEIYKKLYRKRNW